MNDENGQSAPPSPSASPTKSEKVPNRPRLHSKNTMNGPLYMQRSGSNVVLVRRLKRKEDNAWKQLARWFIENQIGTESPFPPLLASFKPELYIDSQI
jgi:hypothetical protein